MIKDTSVFAGAYPVAHQILSGRRGSYLTDLDLLRVVGGFHVAAEWPRFFDGVPLDAADPEGMTGWTWLLASGDEVIVQVLESSSNAELESAALAMCIAYAWLYGRGL